MNSSSEEAIQYAKKYLEDMLSFFGLNLDVYATSEDGDVIELNVPSTHMNGFLIGNHGDTMRSMQYVISMALRSKEFELTRVNVDIADYKKQRATRLEERAQTWLKEVNDTGKDKSLPPMNSADRRTIHKLAGDNGLETVSEGEGRDRHIVLKASSESLGSSSETKDSISDVNEETTNKDMPEATEDKVESTETDSVTESTETEV